MHFNADAFTSPVIYYCLQTQFIFSFITEEKNLGFEVHMSLSKLNHFHLFYAADELCVGFCRMFILVLVHKIWQKKC